MPTSSQMKIYIGGMAGTRKTQVIKAVSHFFSTSKELYRLLMLAPLGTAAALLAGSTYHSVLGINDFRKGTTPKKLAEIRNHILRVDHIFLDEVSMLSCLDLFKISSQLASIHNCHDRPFGGINMIFAGDFAQLPPAIGGEGISLYSRFVGCTSSTLRSQEEALGRALWHQVTTVVILQQNMRQRHMSSEDDQLWTALSNMRYKDCTEEDISFLKSKITSSLPNHSSITHPQFAYVSIITACNLDKDEINRLGCIKFARMTGQLLSDFYSEDHLHLTKTVRTTS